MVMVGTRMLVLSSGNNVGPTADMNRRVVTINLDPGSTRRAPGLGLMALIIVFSRRRTHSCCSSRSWLGCQSGRCGYGC